MTAAGERRVNRLKASHLKPNLFLVGFFFGLFFSPADRFQPNKRNLPDGVHVSSLFTFVFCRMDMLVVASDRENTASWSTSCVMSAAIRRPRSRVWAGDCSSRLASLSDAQKLPP